MAGSRSLSMIDTTFLTIENNDTPMHVASLMIVSPPPGGAEGFAHTLVEGLRDRDRLVEPFNLIVATGPLRRLVPALTPAKEVDLTYHVRHTSLPQPGGERELGELVSHLHGTVLDRSRPLWTCHVIEGLSEGRVAIYTKIHHALTNGVRGIRMTAAAAGSSPEDRWGGIWQTRPRRSTRRREQAARNLLTIPTAIPRMISEGASIAVAATAFLPRSNVEPARLAFTGPRSKLNGRVTGARCVATHQIDLARLRAISIAADASLNDVFLAVCSTAIRRHLLDSDDLPGRSLIAGVPVKVDDEYGQRRNSAGYAMAFLGTDIEDPLERLAAIKTSMLAVKRQLAPMTPQARLRFLTAMSAPGMGVLLTGMGSLLPPPMNVTISNVPGPKEPLYMNGGHVDALYPVSIPFQGQALNVTCVSYVDHLDIGFTGGRDSLPHLQRLAGYTADAVAELEQALHIRLAKPRRQASRSARGGMPKQT